MNDTSRKNISSSSLKQKSMTFLGLQKPAIALRIQNSAFALNAQKPATSSKIQKPVTSSEAKKSLKASSRAHEPVASSEAIKSLKASSRAHEPVVSSEAIKSLKASSRAHEPVASSEAIKSLKASSRAQEPVASSEATKSLKASSRVQEPVTSSESIKSLKASSRIQKPATSSEVTRSLKTSSRAQEPVASSEATKSLKASSRVQEPVTSSESIKSLKASSRIQKPATSSEVTRSLKTSSRIQKPATSSEISATPEISSRIQKCKPVSALDVAKRAYRNIKGQKYKGVEQIYNQVAGIDIGSRLIHVAIVDENNNYQVREFGTLTPDLHAIAEWLIESNVKIGAMEATGVYWIPLFEILRDKGVTPVLLDPKQVKNPPGRKTDVLDCQWIHTLYSCGLLRPAFIPAKDAFRAYVRHRGNLIKGRQRSILQMNKSLLLMNIKLDIAVSEVGGISGINIIRAIAAGEKDPEKLAEKRHPSCKKPKELFIAALTGNFQKTHVFTLKQSLETYDHFCNQIDECDEMILRELQTWKTVAEDSPPLGKPIHPDYARARKPDQNEFNFDMKGILYQKTGVDLTAINALGELTVATIISEIGGREGLDAFPTEKAWCSWIGLCPGNNVSGGKSHGGQSKKCKNRIKTALCMAAMSLTFAQCSLGAYYRRMAARISKSKAIRAVAHKLARLIFRLLKHGNAYVQVGQEAYEKTQEKNRIRRLQKMAKELGYTLIVNPAA